MGDGGGRRRGWPALGADLRAVVASDPLPRAPETTTPPASLAGRRRREAASAGGAEGLIGGDGPHHALDQGSIMPSMSASDILAPSASQSEPSCFLSGPQKTSKVPSLMSFSAAATSSLTACGTLLP
jgi:hypothetical protein